MSSLFKNIFSSKNQRSRQTAPEKQPKPQQFSEYSVPRPSVAIPATAPYHSNRSRPLPRGPRSAYNCEPAPQSSQMYSARALSTEDLRERTVRRKHRKPDILALYNRDPSSDSSDNEALGWQDKLVRLEYENKKLRHRLKQCEAKCTYIHNVKKETERAYVREIDQVDYEKSELLKENEKMGNRVRQLEEALAAMRAGSNPRGFTGSAFRLNQDDTPSSSTPLTHIDDERDEVRCFRRPETSSSRPSDSAPESPIFFRN